MKVGVLAIQGSFAEHGEMLDKIHQDFAWVHEKSDLKNLTHLIIPGGESTTLLKLLKMYGLWEVLQDLVEQNDLKIFGTCAGAILCEYLGMNISIDRNAYGAQQGSFSGALVSDEFLDLRGVFIRAPQIINYGNDVCVLAKFNDMPVLVEEKNFLVATFHPEISGNLVIYKYFLKS